MFRATLFLSLCALLASANTFDWALGNTSIWLSAAAYCDRSTYLSREYKGYSAGFVPTKVIYNEQYDVNGYIGYRPNDNSIYVVFRGTQSTQDWIDDLDFIKTDYSYCPGGKVHKGFLKAESSVVSDVISEVKSLQAKYPSYNVILTGHSLGAALATLTAMDCVANGIHVTLMNFGCPRIYDPTASECVSSKFWNTGKSHYRVTHHKDIVVHTPMESQGFQHIDGEWYEDDYYVKECNGYEDTTCADQWHITSVDDHSWYLGLEVHCENVSRL